ncbi:MAG: lysophospholipid acyltransferase family protein [Thermoguttaceae bacterium]|nr:lysophospholipid acyltransferase family protein [Thermoguttaceae bacterium]
MFRETPKRSPLKTVADLAVYTAARLVIAVVGIFSMDQCRTLAAFLAWLFTDLIPIRRKTLHENLHAAFPDLSRREEKRLIRRMWEHLFLMGGEFFAARRMFHKEGWCRWVEAGQAQEMVRLFFKKRPLIMVTGHFGNFEIGGYTLGLLGYPTFSVARRLDNPYLDRYIGRLRAETGQYIIDKNEGFEDILRVIEGNGRLAFLADQSAGEKGCWVDFFSRPASAYKAMALLSLQYSAPILVCDVSRVNNTPMRFRIEPLGYYDPLDPPEGLETVFEITQWFTSLLEQRIRRNPEQYWWLHRRWKTYGKKISLDAIRRKIRYTLP